MNNNYSGLETVTVTEKVDRGCLPILLIIIGISSVLFAFIFSSADQPYLSEHSSRNGSSLAVSVAQVPQLPNSDMIQESYGNGGGHSGDNRNGSPARNEEDQPLHQWGSDITSLEEKQKRELLTSALASLNEKYPNLELTNPTYANYRLLNVENTYLVYPSSFQDVNNVIIGEEILISQSESLKFPMCHTDNIPSIAREAVQIAILTYETKDNLESLIPPEPEVGDDEASDNHVTSGGIENDHDDDGNFVGEDTAGNVIQSKVLDHLKELVSEFNTGNCGNFGSQSDRNDPTVLVMLDKFTFTKTAGEDALNAFTLESPEDVNNYISNHSIKFQLRKQAASVGVTDEPREISLAIPQRLHFYIDGDNQAIVNATTHYRQGTGHVMHSEYIRRY